MLSSYSIFFWQDSLHCVQLEKKISHHVTSYVISRHGMLHHICLSCDMTVLHYFSHVTSHVKKKIDNATRCDQITACLSCHIFSSLEQTYKYKNKFFLQKKNSYIWIIRCPLLIPIVNSLITQKNRRYISLITWILGFLRLYALS